MNFYMPVYLHIRNKEEKKLASRGLFGDTIHSTRVFILKITA